MNAFNDTSSILKRLRTGALRDPVRDWLVLIVFSMLALAGIIVWNAWAFDTVANGGVIGAPASGAPPVFSRSSLDTIRTIFADREAEEEKYETGTYRFADPSQ